MGPAWAAQLKQKQGENNQNKVSRFGQRLTSENVSAGPVSDSRHISTSSLEQLSTHLVQFPPGQYCVV